jgi:hypothetical protein
MIHIGIDFSLNSPAVCIQDHDGSYQFISFFNYGNRLWETEKTPKAFALHKELSPDTIMAFPYFRDVANKDFLHREREKLIDGKNIAELIVNLLVSMYGTSNVKIALEGFSYGSTGNSFIDIVQYNTFLRSMLLSAYGADNIYIFQPSHVKKIAGKGNANKHYMVKAFQDNILNDKNLKKTKLWKWIADKDFSVKILKPVDDLVDSYFILNSIHASH